MASPDNPAYRGDEMTLHDVMSRVTQGPPATGHSGSAAARPPDKPAYYDHDGMTIYHGDCRDILPHLTPVDVVITDPPYSTNRSENEVPARHWSPSGPSAVAPSASKSRNGYCEIAAKRLSQGMLDVA